MVQEPSTKLMRFDNQFFTGGTVKNFNKDIFSVNPFPKLGSKIVLYFLTSKLSDSWQNWSYQQLCSPGCQEFLLFFYRIAWIIPDKLHFPGNTIRTGRGEYQFFSNRPETQ